MVKTYIIQKIILVLRAVSTDELTYKLISMKKALIVLIYNNNSKNTLLNNQRTS